MDLSISNFLLYFSLIALQFGDWLTTKIFVTREGVEAEANPCGRGIMRKDGSISLSLLIKKIAIGAVGIVLMVSFPGKADIALGICFWAMLRVVLHNACAILSKRYMDYAEIQYTPMKEKSPIELAGIAATSAFRELSLGLFLAILGAWIYFETGRFFLLVASLAVLAMVAMELSTAREYKKKAAQVV